MVLLGLAAVIVFLLLPNQAVLEQRLDLAGRMVPVWGTILGAFALGMILTLAFQVTGVGRKALGRALSLWNSRHREAAQKALDRARRAEREERLDEAIACYREAIEKLPHEGQTHLLLGDALRRTGRAAEAALAHERARRLDPADEEATHALAIDHLEAGRLDEARSELTALVDANPKGSAGLLRRLRDLELRAGNWSAAARAQRRLEALFGKGRPMPAADVRQGLGIRTELARTRWRAGQVRSATTLLRQVLLDDPAFLPARILAAQVRDEQGEPDAAREVLLQGFELTGEPALLDALCELDLGRERPEDAISTLRGLAAVRRWPAAVRLALGKLYLRLEMLDEAAQPFEDLLETEGHSALVAYLLARVEERRGNVHRAASLYRGVLNGPGRDVPQATCRSCGAELPEWRPRCERCGAFGDVTTRWTSEEVFPSGTVAHAPVYPSPEQ